MNKRPIFLMLAVLALTTACNRQADPAATGTAADTTAASTAPTAADTAAADAAAAASASSAPSSTPAPAPDPAAVAAADAAATAALTSASQGPGPVAGTDYVEIQGGQPFEPLNGKIEVVEIFGYVCPACAGFQPLVRAWKPKLPSNVRFTYVPALFGGVWDRYARAYYTAESMGLVEKTHDALYSAIHIEQSLKGERGQDSDQDIANFYAKYGANPQQFVSTMASFTVEAKLNKAKQFAMRSGISGTPSIVIDGKYLVKGKTTDDVLRIANQLIARERGAGGTAPGTATGH
ncbi:MAG: thiol:disulfide interchange protein DsbA/DsbL [Luteimonas sp.]